VAIFLLEIVIKHTILDQIQVGFGFFALIGVGAWPFLSFVGPYKPDSFIFDPFLQIGWTPETRRLQM
jgi:hypothetical protein